MADPLLISVSNAVLLSLSIIGLLRVQRACLSSIIPLIILLVYHTGIYSLTHAIGRYNAPIMPYVILLASYTLVYLFTRGTPERMSQMS